MQTLPHQLGFDADILQIQLNELAWAVDKIFIMESTRTHNKVLFKIGVHSSCPRLH